jgi:hypothetical protein
MVHDPSANTITGDVEALARGGLQLHDVEARRGLENHRPLACVHRLPRGPYSGLVTDRIVASRLVRQGKE